MCESRRIHLTNSQSKAALLIDVHAKKLKHRTTAILFDSAACNSVLCLSTIHSSERVNGKAFFWILIFIISENCCIVRPYTEKCTTHNGIFSFPEWIPSTENQSVNYIIRQYLPVWMEWSGTERRISEWRGHEILMFLWQIIFGLIVVFENMLLAATMIYILWVSACSPLSLYLFPSDGILEFYCPNQNKNPI